MHARAKRTGSEASLNESSGCLHHAFCQMLRRGLVAAPAAVSAASVPWTPHPHSAIRATRNHTRLVPARTIPGGASGSTSRGLIPQDTPLVESETLRALAHHT